jgi:hypothetical protein
LREKGGIFCGYSCIRLASKPLDKQARCDSERPAGKKKNVFITMLSVFGVKKNEHYLMVVTNQLLIDDLFT